MNPTVGTFVHQSSGSTSDNFAVSYGTIIIARPDKTLSGFMPVITFAWLDRAMKPRHRPISHSQN